VERPGRPFGVSVAIVASAFLFTILPLMQIGAVLIVRRHFMNMSFEDDQLGIEPFAIGGDFLGVQESSIFIQAILSIIFLMIAIAAWRGRPPAIRFVLVASVFGLTLLKLVTIIGSSLSQPNFQAGMSSLDGLMRSLGTGQLMIDILVVLYVAWYMNRGPARAFYRGYYLSSPVERMPATRS
jgi:hypothetical protein